MTLSCIALLMAFHAGAGVSVFEQECPPPDQVVARTPLPEAIKPPPEATDEIKRPTPAVRNPPPQKQVRRYKPHRPWHHPRHRHRRHHK